MLFRSDINMRNRYFFFWVLLLVEGVFGVENYDYETKSVMEGDSVPLKPGDTKIPEDDTIQWWFGDKIIARMNKAANIISTSEGDDTGFKGRLKLDQTGSLTVTNTRTTDSGLYKLLIKSTTETSKTFKVNVRDYVKPLSVMEGDPVTLDTNFIKIQKDDQIKWKFEDQVIPTGHLTC
uniref:Immunoglobulin subtype domain-containing protein n=1 Tax=Sinocyclocheilus rhinocerous TaxID=307959 RepID=A0A673IYS2_9TELE